MADKPTSPPPAYFLSLSLENVRSFGEKQTVSFANKEGRPAQWTIILGDNGVGKTTVLKALAGLMLSFEHRRSGGFGYLTALDIGLDDSSWLSRNASHLSIINAKVETGIGLLSLDTVGEHGELSLKPMYTVEDIDTEVNEEDDVKNENFLEDDSEDIAFAFGRKGLRKINGFVCFGYGAGRTIGNTTLTEAPNRNTCESLFNDRADLLNPEEWFLQMEYISLKSSNQAKLSLARVRQILLQVLPDVTDIKIKTTVNYKQYLEFLTPYGWVRLRDMSLGYQTLVVWLTDFASKLFTRYPDSENPLEEPAIVLIDEIDLHLHPSWQRKLIGFLSGIFKNTQFIATAHSPLVVQAATDADANVVLLKREGDQTKVYQGHDLPDVRRWRIEQILSSELFDDTPPLSAQTEVDLTRRNTLLLKKRLTKQEKEELARLSAELTGQPVGTTRPERRAEDLLAKLARNLSEHDLLP